MPLYENVFIARQDVSPPQVDALADALTAVIAELGGTVSKKEYWGLRNEMERQMRFNEDILRFMTVRVDELEEGPSMMMQKPPRDERGERGGGRRGEGFGDGPRRGRSRDDEGSDDGVRRGRGPRDDLDVGGLE
jgi:small subunit ribosomal protein S6